MPNNFFRKIPTDSAVRLPNQAQKNSANHLEQSTSLRTRVQPLDTFTGSVTHRKHRRELHIAWGVVSGVHKKKVSKRSLRDRLIPDVFHGEQVKWLKKKLKPLSDPLAIEFSEQIRKWFTLFTEESIHSKTFLFSIDNILNEYSPADFVKMSQIMMQANMKNMPFSKGISFFHDVVMKNSCEKITGVFHALEIIGLNDFQKDAIERVVNLFLEHVPQEHYVVCAELLYPTASLMRDDIYSRNSFIVNVVNDNLFYGKNKDALSTYTGNDEDDDVEEEIEEIEWQNLRQIERALNDDIDDIDDSEQICCPLVADEIENIPRTIDFLNTSDEVQPAVVFAVDLENVMQSGRTGASLRAMQMLIDRYANPFNCNRVLYVIRCYLNAARMVRVSQKDLEVENGQSYPTMVLSNALRTLLGPEKSNDITRPIAVSKSSFVLPSGKRLQISELCALVWVIVTSYKNRDMTAEEQTKARENLIYSFVAALAACIEDDGHRVCPNGTGQRLVTVLQGYCGVRIDMVTPQTLLCELAREFDEKFGDNDKSDQDMIDFSEHAMKIARMHFAQDPESLQIFTQHLDEYALLN